MQVAAAAECVVAVKHQGYQAIRAHIVEKQCVYARVHTYVDGSDVINQVMFYVIQVVVIAQLRVYLILVATGV